MAVDVKMRPPGPADSDRMLAWRNLPEIRRWMYTDHVISQEEHDRWFAGALADPSRRYWIIELDGLAVGLGAYVEYFVIEHVFGELGLNKLCCEVLIDNEAVWKMHEAFGFAREALFREHVWKDGKATDVVALGLLASDWSTIREASRERLAARGFPV